MKNLINVMLCCCILLGSMTSCVNSLDEADEAVRPGTVPISFLGKVSKLYQTRVSDKALDAGDELGLMAVMSGGQLTGTRYIDNLRLRASDTQALVPDEVVYYPEGEGAKLDFVAYYPFVSSGLAAGSSQMTVSVEKNQQVDENRKRSDFLVAVKNKVGASKESVSLSFKHKLAKVKVELVLDKASEADDLLDSNPEIRACGFMTRATYDFAKDEFSDLADPAVVNLWGTWKKSGNKLVGKEMIVVPQTVQPEHQYFVLEVRGKLYTCTLTGSSLGSNSQRVISIGFHEAVDSELTGFVGEVQDWSDGAVTEEEAESAYQMGCIQTELLSCGQSNVYHIFHQGQLLAELCREYLRLPDVGIDSPAWVVYPAHDGVVNLSEGKVLELLEVTEPVHGGKIAWNQEENTAVYVPGTEQPIRSFFLDEAGKVVLTKPDKPLAVHVKTYELRDIRGNVVKNYGVVKIGAQYWMREELKADRYADGTPLQREETMTGEPCCLCSKDGRFYYNREALNAGNMATAGWMVPKNSDWKRLVDYVGSVAALKAGKWTLLSGSKEELAPVTNRAMFYGYPAGIWMEHLNGTGSMLLFWGLDESGLKAADKAFGLVAHYTDFQLINTTNPNTSLSKGLSIRLLRK